MHASADFTLWTPDEVVELLRLEADHLAPPCLRSGESYKWRMNKARRSRAYVYLVEAEVAGHRFHKVGLTFSSNPLERDPVAYKKALASSPASGAQADAFESAAISWLRLKFRTKVPPPKVWHWSGNSEIIDTTDQGVLYEFNALISRCQEFCKSTKPIWIIKDNLLMAEIWASLLSPYFVSSSSPVFNRHRERIAQALGLDTDEAVSKYKKSSTRRSNTRHAAYRKLNPQ